MEYCDHLQTVQSSITIQVEGDMYCVIDQNKIWSIVIIFKLFSLLSPFRWRVICTVWLTRTKYGVLWSSSNCSVSYHHSGGGWYVLCDWPEQNMEYCDWPEQNMEYCDHLQTVQSFITIQVEGDMFCVIDQNKIWSIVIIFKLFSLLSPFRWRVTCTVWLTRTKYGVLWSSSNCSVFYHHSGGGWHVLCDWPEQNMEYCDHLQTVQSSITIQVEGDMYCVIDQNKIWSIVIIFKLFSLLSPFRWRVTCTVWLTRTKYGVLWSSSNCSVFYHHSGGGWHVLCDWPEQNMEYCDHLQTVQSSITIQVEGDMYCVIDQNKIWSIVIIFKLFSLLSPFRWRVICTVWLTRTKYGVLWSSSNCSVSYHHSGGGWYVLCDWPEQNMEYCDHLQTVQSSITIQVEGDMFCVIDQNKIWSIVIIFKLFSLLSPFRWRVTCTVWLTRTKYGVLWSSSNCSVFYHHSGGGWHVLCDWPEQNMEYCDHLQTVQSSITIQVEGDMYCVIDQNKIWSIVIIFKLFSLLSPFRWRVTCSVWLTRTKYGVLWSSSNCSVFYHHSGGGWHVLCDWPEQNMEYCDHLQTVQSSITIQVEGDMYCVIDQNKIWSIVIIFKLFSLLSPFRWRVTCSVWLTRTKYGVLWSSSNCSVFYHHSGGGWHVLCDWPEQNMEYCDHLQTVQSSITIQVEGDMFCVIDQNKIWSIVIIFKLFSLLSPFRWRVICSVWLTRTKYGVLWSSSNCSVFYHHSGGGWHVLCDWPEQNMEYCDHLQTVQSSITIQVEGDMYCVIDQNKIWSIVIIFKLFSLLSPFRWRVTSSVWLTRTKYGVLWSSSNCSVSYHHSGGGWHVLCDWPEQNMEYCDHLQTVQSSITIQVEGDMFCVIDQNKIWSIVIIFKLFNLLSPFRWRVTCSVWLTRTKYGVLWSSSNCSVFYHHSGGGWHVLCDWPEQNMEYCDHLQTVQSFITIQVEGDMYCVIDQNKIWSIVIIFKLFSLLSPFRWRVTCSVWLTRTKYGVLWSSSNCSVFYHHSGGGWHVLCDWPEQNMEYCDHLQTVQSSITI